jgi:hypothetical protein
MKHLLLLLAIMANSAFLLAMESAAPSITCINGLSANLDGSASVTIWASDVLLYAEDDNTPANQLVFGIRVAGNGSGFPFDASGNPILNQTFGCIHLGIIDLELWVMDADGNTSYCTTYVIVEDNFNNCPPVIDTINPTIVCINGMSVNIEPSATVTVWTTDVLEYAQDDITQNQDLVYGIRVAGNGSGFPAEANGDPIVNQVFECIHIGTIELELWVKDQAGNTDFCLTTVVVQDGNNNCPPVVDSVSPTIVCLNGLSANVGPDGTITIWTSDLLQYAEDNITPNQLLVFGMRQAGSGSGFPFDANGNPIENIVFGCENLGSNLVELWVVDQAGNSVYCTVTVIISDNSNNCPFNPASGTAESGAVVRSLHISPNPASGSSSLLMRCIDAGTNWNLQITESSGRLVRQDIGSGPAFDLSGKGLAPGLYFLRLLCDDGKTHVGKLNIQ